jgi:hypothetical protein
MMQVQSVIGGPFWIYQWPLLAQKGPAPGQAAGTRQWGEAVAVDDDGNIYMGMNGTKGVERYARR